MAGLTMGLAGRLQVNHHTVSFDSGVESRLAVRELGVKTEDITVMLYCSQHVLHNKYGGGAAKRRRRGSRHGSSSVFQISPKLAAYERNRRAVLTRHRHTRE